jgi:hypothetical protein
VTPDRRGGREGDRATLEAGGPQDAEPSRASMAASGLALAAAAGVVLLAPGALGAYTDLIWLLALAPVFLLSYRSGWRGAALAALLALAVFVAVEVLGAQLLGRGVDWRLFGAGTLVLAAVGVE